MAKEYDATLKDLIDAHTDEWARYLCARIGIPAGPVEILDTDLSTTVQADRLFRVNGPRPAVVHLELESSGHLGRAVGLLRYNVLAHFLTQLPVHSIILLLRPGANSTDLTGEFELVGADGRPYLLFRYQVVRLWQEGVEHLLNAGAGLAPLALLTDEAERDPVAAFTRFRERLRRPDVPDTVARSLFASTYLLCGLRYSWEQVEDLYRRLSMILEESSTYQHLLSRGAQAILLRLGRSRFGDPSPAAESAIRTIEDKERLGRMADRMLTANSWDDLLATP